MQVTEAITGRLRSKSLGVEHQTVCFGRPALESLKRSDFSIGQSLRFGFEFTHRGVPHVAAEAGRRVVRSTNAVLVHRDRTPKVSLEFASPYHL